MVLVSRPALPEGVVTSQRILRGPSTLNKRGGMAFCLSCIRWAIKWDIPNKFRDVWAIVSDAADEAVSVQYSRCSDTKMKLEDFWSFGSGRK